MPASTRGTACEYAVPWQFRRTPRVTLRVEDNTDSAAFATDTQKLQFLSDGTNLGEQGAPVERIETHFAWVLLTPRHAFKLRKAIRYHGIDTLSLDAREATCRTELRLNQPLAPDVYLDVVPLLARPDRRLQLGGEGGQPIDWLLRMRRLPTARMLDSMARAGVLRAADLDRLLRHLRSHYAQLQPIVMSAEEYHRRLSTGIDENRIALQEAAAVGIDASAGSSLARLQHGLLERLRPLLARRAEGNCIRECHGDLRPEHISLGPPILIIDRLDFDRDLRLLDPLEELCFLKLEAERLGVPPEQLPVQRYVEGPLDAAGALVDFYVSNRASARARLAAWHLMEPDADRPELTARIHYYVQRATNAATRASD